MWRARIFGSRTAGSVAITNCAMYVTAKPKPRQTGSPHAWANHVGSMLLEYLDSDTDASVVIVLLQWLNQLQNYSRDTSKNYQLNTCSINSHESRARPILPEDTFQTSLTSLYVAVFLKNDKG